MSTRTTYYNLTKPDADEHVLRTVINQNYDAIDLQMHANAEAAKEAAAISADEHNTSTTYYTGDFCIYQNTLYRMTAAGTTSGDFDPTKWTATTIAAAFEPKHTWTLLETITADGETAVYQRDIPTGVSGIFVKIIEAAGSTADLALVYTSCQFTGESSWNNLATFGNMISNVAKYAQNDIQIENGRIHSLFTQAVTSVGGTQTVYSRSDFTYFSKSGIQKLRITGQGSNPHPSGSTFEIYIRT